MSDTEKAWEPSIGSIITDNGHGWPWVRTAGGKWTRDACQTFLTWDEVYAWVQAAVDDPDDETTEPFHPVLMVDGTAARLAALEEAAAYVESLDDAAVRDGAGWARRIRALHSSSPYRADQNGEQP